MPNDADPLDRLRALCLALPEATEKLSWEHHPTFRVRDKIFVLVQLADAEADRDPAFWCKAPPGLQEALVGTDRNRYFVPPYLGGRGWLGVRLGAGVDWEEIGEHVEESYRLTAPKRLLARLDER